MVRRLSHAALLVACGVLAFLLPQVIDRAWPRLLEPVELWTVDLRFQVRAPLGGASESQDKSPLFVAVDYDERAGRELGLGRWPWDRRVHAQLIDWLKTGGARAVALDLLFDYPSRDHDADQALAAAIERAGNVFLPMALVPGPPIRGLPGQAPEEVTSRLLPIQVAPEVPLPIAADFIPPLPEMSAGAAGLGHIQRTVDSDGIMRRLPLLFRTPAGIVPSLGLAAAFRHLDVESGTVRLEPRGGGGWTLRFRPRQGEDITIPLDHHGRAWINYAGRWGTRFIHFPYSWLRDQLSISDQADSLEGWFQGKSVVVANLTTGSGDQGPIPFERDFAFGELHLHVLNMIQTRQFLRDATSREALAMHVTPVLLIAGIALAGGAGLILTGFAVILGGLLVTWNAGFHQGVILPTVAPTLSLVSGVLLLLSARFFIVDRERWRFLSILGNCLPPQTIRLIKQQPHQVKTLLAGRRRELTILFADVQGFSTYCKRVPPNEVQEVLHDYLTAMTNLIRAQGGTLDKYMGDGLMAFFGDAEPEAGGPEEEEARVARHAGNAVTAALAMQRGMGELNAAWLAQNRDTHAIRIGINTGLVTVGNMGTEFLWDYTVVGTEVNKAQRLEGAAAPGGVLLAHRTYLLARREGAVPEEIPAEALTLKGLGVETDLHMVTPQMIADWSLKDGHK
jgi:adenylate cyclase